MRASEEKPPRMRAYVIESRGIRRFPLMWWIGRNLPDWDPERLPNYDWVDWRPCVWPCCA